jgi:ADP-ribose pyrophosphatase YjhB (NUDIX family)
MYCNNCGKKGHVFKICRDPIISCGLILINKSKLPIEDSLELLMVKRKDSMAYTEFLRGKYTIEDTEYIRKLLSNMTSEEQIKISSNSFEFLWNSHWGDHTGHSREYESSSKKFNELNFKELLKDISSFIESEWGFPKGRRIHKETDLDCAIREFSEETNIPRTSYTICSNLILKETFIGTNGIPYSHIYFVALKTSDIILSSLNSMQEREISAISWKSLQECHSLTRPHYSQRKEMLNSLERIVNTFNT